MTIRNCKICGKPLSRYNKDVVCFHHHEHKVIFKAPESVTRYPIHKRGKIYNVELAHPDECYHGLQQCYGGNLSAAYRI